MIITEHIEKPVERDYFFVTGIINFDFNYFIQKIEEGIQLGNNNNYIQNILLRK